MTAATLRDRISDWIYRLPASEQAPVRLHRRRVYILPSRFGWAFAVMILLLLVGSINYGLSLGYVLTFLLAGLGWISMGHTYRNLVEVEVRWPAAAPVFAPGPAMFTLAMTSARGERYALDARCGEAAIAGTDLERGAGRVTLAVPAPKRGLVRLPTVLIETRYPLGLFRVWARLRPDATCLVYPAPAPPGVPLPAPEANERGVSAARPGSDELQFLRPYRPGDSPRHIAWRAYARERGLLTRQFTGEGGGRLWLDLGQAPGHDLEQKISQLTRWALDAENAGIAYGLRLPGVEIAPALGADHRHAVLKSLALYGLAP